MKEGNAMKSMEQLSPGNGALTPHQTDTQVSLVLLG